MLIKNIFVLEVLQNQINSSEFKEKHRLNERCFIRDRGLNFSKVVLMILNNISKSLSVELTNFLQKIGNSILVSKQAFSKARYKLKKEAFIELNDTLIQNYYQQGDYQLYKGKYLLLSCDGSDYELPWEDDLIEEFGVHDNTQGQPKCMARGVKIWDIMNQLTISSTLGSYQTSEMALFEQSWEHALSLLSQRVEGQPLLLGDRYYPSLWLMVKSQQQGWDFLFRARCDFCKEVVQFIKGTDKEQILNISLTDCATRRWRLRQKGIINPPKFIKVRAIRVIRPTGEQSCLLTSLLEETFEQIIQLYPDRWGVETSYYFDKHRTEIENFSAKLAQGIYQDWYANTLNTNIAQLLIEQAQQLLDQEQKTKSNKYNYQINRSVAVGLVKDELPKMLFGKEPPDIFYQRLTKLILRHREPIRPNREFPRKRKHKLKFSMNLRRVI